MMSFKKRGVGAIISWVLLLGFAVALAVSIFSWWKIQTEEHIESTIDFVEGALECEQVSIGVEITRCGSYPRVQRVDITNTGKLKLDAFILRNIETDREDSKTHEIELMPFESTGEISLISLGLENAYQLEVMPLLRKGTKYHVCSEKKITLVCPENE